MDHVWAKPSIYGKVINMKISDAQLGVIIASQIREKGLNDVFDASVVEKIKAGVKSEYKRMRATPVDALIPEGDGNVPVPTANTSPYNAPVGDDDGNEVPSVEMEVQPALEVGSQPTDIPYAPKLYTPELPDMLQHVKPAKLVAMELNDITEGGEMLASKPFRTMDDIDVQKSMVELWKEEGVTKAEVYVIKFERAGEMSFDYANGTSVFVPTPSPSATIGVEGPKTNPYADENPNGPNRFSEPSSEEIEAYVKTSVNVEDIVKKVAIELMAKAYEEQTRDHSRQVMGMTEPATPEPNNEIPAAIYESFQLGGSVKGVEFLSTKNGVTCYRYKGKEYAICDSSVMNKMRTT